MEIYFQQQEQLHYEQVIISMSKERKLKGKSRSNNKMKMNKFVGVRQRASGRWVAEIKDTTKKIRMWLGTFETAEEAARAYDEAACLLRGSNTRTNFAAHVSTDSPIASRIRNLLNSKKLGSKLQQQRQEEEDEQEIVVDSTVYTVNSNSTSSGEDGECRSHQDDQAVDLEDVYKPDMSNCSNGKDGSKSDYDSWGNCFDRFPFAQQVVLDLPKNDQVSPSSSPSLSCSSDQMSNVGISEFERMKVERQISASLYAMNGVQEYMQALNDLNEEPLWDLPPLCSLFYQ